MKYKEFENPYKCKYEKTVKYLSMTDETTYEILNSNNQLEILDLYPLTSGYDFSPKVNKFLSSIEESETENGDKTLEMINEQNPPQSSKCELFNFDSFVLSLIQENAKEVFKDARNDFDIFKSVVTDKSHFTLLNNRRLPIYENISQVISLDEVINIKLNRQVSDLQPQAKSQALPDSSDADKILKNICSVVQKENTSEYPVTTKDNTMLVEPENGTFNPLIDKRNGNPRGYTKYYDISKKFGFISLIGEASPDVFVFGIEFKKAKISLNIIKKSIGNAEALFEFRLEDYWGKHGKSRKAADIRLFDRNSIFN